MRKVWIEALGVATGLAVLLRVLVIARNAGLISGDTLALGTSILLLGVPAGWYYIADQDPWNYGARTDRLKEGLYYFVIISLATLPLFFLGNHILQTWILGRSFEFHLPAQLGERALGEVFGIALPEEFFYRGYLQTRLEQASRPRFKVFGVQFGWGLVVALVFFAAAHSVVSLQLWHVGILAPAFVFAWLRVRTDSVIAGALYHALCNLAMWTAELSYRGDSYRG